MKKGGNFLFGLGTRHSRHSTRVSVHRGSSPAWHKPPTSVFLFLFYIDFEQPTVSSLIRNYGASHSFRPSNKLLDFSSRRAYTSALIDED